MKKIIACICEGGAESFIINKLLDEDKLIFNREDLLEGELIRERSAAVFEKKYLSKGFEGKIELYIIHDSIKENFKLSKLYKHKVDVKHIITYPEIEMLVIIKENKYLEYKKSKKSLVFFVKKT
ncbi:hypothetical protein [Streptobacillus felis]|uniref:hypothetical protein n=1 Tax=Streptobacillus felis TaxID=1384509 RepID=UPI001C55462D|nr:hypothetical protein [Streptobacillus felis]